MIHHITGASEAKSQEENFHGEMIASQLQTSPEVLLPSVDSSYTELCIKYMQENSHLLRDFQKESRTYASNILNKWVNEEQNLEYIKEHVKNEIQTCLDCVVLDAQSDSSYLHRSNDVGAITFYVVVGKPYGYSWYNITSEHFTNLCEHGLSNNLTRARRGRRKLQDEAVVVFSSPKIIQSLHTNNPELYSYFSVMVNHSISVKIYSNPTLSLCFNGFVEEISEFIGNEQLLKRSFAICTCFLQNQITFLRASSTRTNNNSQRINWGWDMHSEIVWVLVLMVFNKYPVEAIAHPLQCLHFLLIEMSVYEPQRHILSIFGLMNIQSFSIPSSSQLIMLPQAILDKYMKQFSLTNLLLPAMVSDAMKERTSQIQQHQDVVAHTSSKKTFLYLHPFNQVMRTSTADVNFKTSSNSIADIFHFGVVRYTKFLQDFKEDNQIVYLSLTSDEKYQYLRDLLVNSTNNFPPPQTSHSPSSNHGSPRDARHSVNNLQQIHSALAYCHMIYRGIINDASLQYAVIHALEMKGALPVGEIGKAMSIHCDAADLSKYIKDKHGGLKKYLERYPSLFVFGDDHEFNPHVFLASSLSEEHKVRINRQTNTISMEYMIQYRQV
jgi:hypothetical protein